MMHNIRQGKRTEKYPTDFKMNDFYKYYKNTYLHLKVKNKTKKDAVTRQLFSKIIYKYYEYCINDVVYKNKTLRFTAYLGTFKIMKRQPLVVNDKMMLPIDYNETIKLWENDKEAYKNKQYVRHLNNHTDNYLFFYKWVKTYCKVKNCKWYSFKASRTNKLLLSNAAKNDGIDCFEFDTTIMQNLINKHLNKET